MPALTTAQSDAFEVRVWADMIAAAPPALVQATGLKVTDVSGVTCFTAPGIPSNEFNRANGLGLTSPATPQQIDAVLAHYRSLGLTGAWLQIADDPRPADLKSQLAARGVTETGKAWVFLGRTPGPMPEARIDLRIAPVEPQDAARVAQVFGKGYGLPPAFEPWMAALATRPGWRSYAAWDGDSPVAAANLYLEGTLALLAGAATLPEARGRGAQTALIARRAADAAALGATWLQSHTWRPGPGAHNPSLTNLERAGFGRLHYRENLTVGTP